MSGTAGAAPPTVVLGFGLGPDAGGSWQQRAAGRSGAAGAPGPGPGSGLPLASAAGPRGSRTPLRLPSLVSGPRRRTSMTRLSLSEPSLFTTNDNLLFEGPSCRRRSGAAQKQHTPPATLSRSSALLPSRRSSRPLTSSPHLQTQVTPGCCRPAYIHFSHAIQPCTRPRPLRRHSHSPAPSSETVHAGLRPSALQSRNSPFDAESLSVVGKPCLLSCTQRSVGAAGTIGPARTQLHVFLPSEADGEEADSESVDEGFMDELDNKISTLKIQQGAAKAASHKS